MLNQPMSSPMITIMFGRCCCAAAGIVVATTAASSASATRHNFRMIFMVLPPVENRPRLHSSAGVAEPAMRIRQRYLAGVNARTRRLNDGLWISFERENSLPVVLHADHRPAALHRLVVKRLREGADLAVGKASGGPISVFACGIVVQHQHLEPGATAGRCPFTHVAVVGRVAERRERPPADHEID